MHAEPDETDDDAPLDFDAATGWSRFSFRKRSRYFRSIDGQPDDALARLGDSGILAYVDDYGALHAGCTPGKLYEILSGQPDRFTPGYVPPEPRDDHLITTAALRVMIQAPLTAERIERELKGLGRQDLTAANPGRTKSGRLWPVDVLVALQPISARLRAEDEDAAQRAFQMRNVPMTITVRFPASCDRCSTPFNKGAPAVWRSGIEEITCMPCDSMVLTEMPDA